MIRLKSRQRTLLLEKVPDVANLAVGALVFGQFIGEQPFSIGLAFVGIATWSVLIAFPLVIAGGEQR